MQTYIYTSDADGDAEVPPCDGLRYYFLANRRRYLALKAAVRRLQRLAGCRIVALAPLRLPSAHCRVVRPAREVFISACREIAAVATYRVDTLCGVGRRGHL